MEEMKAVKNKKKGVIIGAVVGVLVLVVGVFFALFYESEEEYQARVVEAVEQKIETVMVTNEYWPMFTNKQWYYREDETGHYEVVSVDGTVTNYGMSMPMRFDFYIDDEDYVCRITYTFNGITNGQDIPHNENSKLDL